MLLLKMCVLSTTMRCLDAKMCMCRLIAGGTKVTSKEGVVHPTFGGGHIFEGWPWVGSHLLLAEYDQKDWMVALTALPWRRMFLKQNVMFDSCLLAFDESATGGVQLHRDLRHGEEFFTTSTTTRATATLFFKP